MSKNLTILIGVVLFAFLMVGCKHKQDLLTANTVEFEQAQKDPNWTSAGVVVYSSGWIENTNEFPVKVHFVNTRHNYDVTVGILTLQPRQVFKGNFYRQDIYNTYCHIYDIKGKPIGFIQPEKPT